jgi:hypothetical protein
MKIYMESFWLEFLCMRKLVGETTKTPVENDRCAAADAHVMDRCGNGSLFSFLLRLGGVFSS